MSATIAETAERVTSVDHPVLESVTDRENYIMDLMLADKWHPRKTRHELASAWGVSDSTVQNYSAAAGRAIEESLKDTRSAMAFNAMERLKSNAIHFADATLPGDAAAAVRANEIILKATGFSEPEEDKAKPTTVVLVGQIATSPAMQMLVASGARAPRLNGHSNGAQTTQAADELPAPDRNGGMVPGRGNGSGVD